MVGTANCRSTINHRIFETSTRFHVISALWEKFNSFFEEFFASINKIFILAGGDCALGYHSLQFRHFLDIS